MGGPPARALYAGGYSIKRLRERSAKRSAHDRYADLWEGVKIVFRGLDEGEPRLALPALKGLFAKEQCPALDAGKLQNSALLLAMFRLSWLREPTGLARVNWRDMGPEELGSVYESLLELVPQIQEGGRRFTFLTGGETKGNARKTSGSYYTPDSLVQVLLDSALEPVVESTIAANPKDPAGALLSLAVVDPACGSGHFLLAAARRLAAHVARLTAEGTPSAAEYRHALRQVVAKCIYGVDLNPMAVELCKVSLWMEALEPGLPLTFLKSHIRQGNALLGTTPELMEKGIPDDAWSPIEGDDKKIASALKKKNKSEQKGQALLDFGLSKSADGAKQLARAVAELDAASDADPALLAAKEAQWESILASPAYRHQRFIADAWCAAFVWPKHPGVPVDAAPTNAVWKQLGDVGRKPNPATVAVTVQLTEQYRFFHWHLAFPQVFERGGFDVVLGNPPWEELTPSAKEFFSVFDPSIRFRDKAGEKEVTSRLLNDATIASAWQSHRRQLFGLVHSIKSSGRYRLFAPGNLGKGDFNVYRMFVETALDIVRDDGFVAQFIPETFYAGATTMAIRQRLIDSFDWQLLVGLENSGEVWFKGVDSRAKFCLYAARRAADTTQLRVAFNIRSPSHLAEALRSNDPIHISPQTIRLFSPDALAIMELNSQADVDLATKMHGTWPALGSDLSPPPAHKHMREIDMTTDSSLFRSEPPGLPLYEGRMVGLFDHRAKGYCSGKARSAYWIDYPFSAPEKRIQPQFYIRAEDLPPKLGDRPHRYRAGFCNIASPTNERTLVTSLIPAGAVCGNKVPTITFGDGHEWYAALWIGIANSFVMDFLVRKKVSLTMTNTVIDSLPFPKLAPDDARARHLVPLAARLCCVGREMQAFWDALVRQGWVDPLNTETDGIIDEAQRAAIDAEINAVVALQIFNLHRDQLAHVLDTFPIVRKNDEKAHGEYRTKRVILEIYDALAAATQTGLPYPTRLDPPPADPSVAHPRREGAK